MLCSSDDEQAFNNTWFQHVRKDFQKRPEQLQNKFPTHVSTIAGNRLDTSSSGEFGLEPQAQAGFGGPQACKTNGSSLDIVGTC